MPEVQVKPPHPTQKLMDSSEREENHTLEILRSIEQQHDLSQRDLANRMGIALGLANSCLKRCIKKGLVKIQQAPANRYLYYLTPRGFTEKSRLTAKYLSISFDFYRKAGESFEDIFDLCEMRGWNQVVLVGASELAEIAMIRATGRDIQVVALYEPEAKTEHFHGTDLHNSISELPEHQAYILTEFNNPIETLENLKTEVDPERVLIPRILELQGSIEMISNELEINA